MPDTVTLRDREGQSYGVPQDQAAAYVAQGFRPEGDEEHVERLGSEVQQDLYGGPLGAAGALGSGALSGLTMGASDLGIEALGGGGALRGLSAQHGIAGGVGTVLGAIAPTILSGGAAAPEEAAGIGARILAHSPAALVSKVGGAVTHLGEGAGLVGRAAAGTAGAAAEGALYGGGQYLTEAALEDKPLSAEGFVAGMGHGALFAAPIGAAGTLASATLQRARSLFPRSEVSAAAAAGVKAQATSSIAQAVRDGDEMAAAAERKLSDVDAKAQMAQAGETVTRRVFGGADPQAIGDQVTGAVDRQQVTQALQSYQQARQGLQDWIASEADPELERALRGNPTFRDAFGKLGSGQPALDKMLASAAPDDLETMLGQMGGRAPGDPGLEKSMRALVDRPDVVGAGGMPVGEFGAPGARGIKTPDELARIAEGSAGDGVGPALEQTGTRQLRSGARGTPVEPAAVPAQEIVQRGMADEGAAVGGRAPIPDAVPGPTKDPTSFTATDRPAGGSQGGAWYRDEHGQQWFGKHYGGNTDRIEGEHVANEVYRMFGVNAPETRIRDVDGKRMLMSREVPGRVATSAEDIVATDARDGFVLDAWLANHDVVGTGYDNILVAGPKAVRIDNGGATIWRAQGENKEFKALVSELDSMRDPQRYAGRAFAGLTQEQVDAQVQRFAVEYPAKKATIDQLIDRSALSRKAKEQIKTGLHDRAAWLIDRAKGNVPELSDDEFSRLASGGQAALTEPQRETAMAYTRQGLYAQLNAPLREMAGKAGGGGLKPVAQHLHEVVQRLDDAAAASPAPRDMVVSRGVNGQRSTASLSKLQIGDVYVDPGFVSTSYSAEIGSDFAKGFDVRKGVELKISVPKGYPALAIPSEFPKEREILLGRGGRFIVTGREDGENRVILHMALREPDAFEAVKVPDAFTMKAIDSRGNAMFVDNPDVAFGIPEHSDVPSAAQSRNVGYIVKPSELADRGIIGKTRTPAEPWNGSLDLPAIEVSIHRKSIELPNGRIEYATAGYSVDDGAKRLLAAAADGDRPVLVRFFPSARRLDAIGGESLAEDIKTAIGNKTRGATGSPQGGAAPVAEAVERHPLDVKRAQEAERHPLDVARDQAASATDTLTGQLRGTAAKLDSGENLVAMGAPARAEYRATKAERATEAAKHFRAKALAARGEVTTAFDAKDLDLRFDSESRTYHPVKAPPKSGASPDAPWNDGFSGHTTPENSRMAAEERAAQAEHQAGILERSARQAESAGHDPLAQFGLESASAQGGSAAGHVPDELKAMMLPERTRVDAGIKPRMQGVADEAAIAKAIMRHNGKGADMGPSLARAAKAIGDMEDASARLTDLLGSEAPPTAVSNAKAFRTATGQANERAAASSAKAAADLTGKVPAADSTLVDDDIAKALRKHDMQTGKVPAVGSPATGAVPATSGIGSKIADAGSALEVLRAIGAHVPAISHIPVIGPILGLWLKARAVMGILGRKGGSIGKSTEGVIAAKAAATRDRIVAATGSILDGAAKVAGKAGHLAGPAVLLAGKLFPGGSKPASDKPRDLYEARMDEIARAQSTGAIDQAIAQRYPTSDPGLHDALVAQIQRGIAFLDGKAPKQTMSPGVLPGDGTWAPSMAAIEEFAKYVHAINDPVSVLEDLAKGHVYAEGAETLRTVYPQLYQYAQKELLQAAPAMAKTLPYPRRVMISILYGIPVDGTLNPSHAQYLQIPSPSAPAPSAPTVSGPLRLGQQVMSPLDHRASGM